MKKLKLRNIFMFIFLVILFIFIVYHLFNIMTVQTVVEKDKVVCLNSRCFNVDVAETAVERERGFMFRKELDNNEGMLFVFPTSEKYGFWMKNTLIPLDIIWIDKNWIIIDVKEKAENCYSKCQIYYPKKDIKYVLELNSGIFEKYNFSIGDKVIALIHQ